MLIACPIRRLFRKGSISCSFDREITSRFGEEASLLLIPAQPRAPALHLPRHRTPRCVQPGSATLNPPVPIGARPRPKKLLMCREPFRVKAPVSTHEAAVSGKASSFDLLLWYAE